MQYPPSIIITKRPDGTVEFSGFAIEILDYTAKALDIRKVINLVQCNSVSKNLMLNLFYLLNHQL